MYEFIVCLLPLCLAGFFIYLTETALFQPDPIPAIILTAALRKIEFSSCRILEEGGKG
jgi:hypothetical protein